MKKYQTDDYDLIQAFARGDQEAAGKLVERYYCKVLSLCHYYLYAQGESHDAAQEVFLHIVGRKKVLGFRGEVKLWTWLYRVTVNCCKARLLARRNLIEKIVLYGIESDLQKLTCCITRQNPENITMRRDIHDCLINHVEQLPKKYRAPLILIYFREYSYADAACYLKINRNSLAVRLSRAKKQLAKKIRRTDLQHRIRQAQGGSFRTLAWLPESN